ncbi:MAG TPA: MFS transporter [Streptosporangiaceae bacterium]
MAAESTIAGRPGGGPADEAGGDGGGTARRSLGMIVVMTGVLITAVDTTIVVLALPAIERELHVALSSVIWVVIGYLLVITLLATQVGRLGDMFGRVRMYEAGFAVFVIGSVLCALAWNEGAIIGFRIVQAVGGAFVTANSGAVIADLYPPKERGRAYGFNAVGWSMGAVLGVVLGGTIVTYVSWRWIFWINVPIGVAALVLAVRVLHERGERVRRRLDPAGMLALGLGLFGVLWAMTKLASAPLDAEQVGYLIGGVIMLAVFVVIELRQREPMLDLSLFKIPVMAPSLLASLFQGLASFAVLFLIIMYLQGPRGLTPIHASLLLVPGYVIGSAFGPLAGRVADKVGPVIPATAGLGIQVVALFIFAHLGIASGLWLVVAGSVVNSIGASCFFPANSAAVMKASPQAMLGISSGVLRTFANIGMVFSFTTAILIASHSISRGLAFAIFVGTTSLHGPLAVAFTTGLHAAFYTMMAFMAIAAVLSAVRGRVGTRPAAEPSASTPAA